MTQTKQQRILITGATSGIGLATALKLAAEGHSITYTARSAAKAKETEVIIREAVPSADISFVLVDLTCFTSVENVIVELTKVHQPFDTVILNAAVMFPEECETKYGLESSFQVNFLAHYLLATSLVANRPVAHKIHFVCLSSVLLKMFNGFPWKISRDSDKWHSLFAPKGKSGWKAYALSKFALSVFAETLNRLEDVSAVAVNPGNTQTAVTRNMKGKKFFKIFKNTLIPVEQAADNVIRGAMNPLPSGMFYDKHRQSPLPKAVRSEYSSHALIALSEKLLDQAVPTRKYSGNSVKTI